MGTPYGSFFGPKIWGCLGHCVFGPKWSCWFFEPIHSGSWELSHPPSHSWKNGQTLGISMFFCDLGPRVLRALSTFSELDPLFSKFLGFRQMNIQDLFWGLDMDSPHRVWKNPFWDHLARQLSKLWQYFFKNPPVSPNLGGALFEFP